jgi:hypothetical protein
MLLRILRKCLLGGVGVAAAMWKEFGLFRDSINAVPGGQEASWRVQIRADEALQLQVRFIIHWRSCMGMTKRRDTTVRQPTRRDFHARGGRPGKAIWKVGLLEQKSKSCALQFARFGPPEVDSSLS